MAMPDFNLKQFDKEVFIGHGVSHANHNQSVLLNSVSGLRNTYTNNSNESGTVLLGFGLSKVYKTMVNGSKFSLGLEASYQHNATISGDLQPATNILPNIDPLYFHYQLDSAMVLINAKVVKDKLLKSWGGYVKAAVGGAYNHTSNYHETIPTGSGTAPMLLPFGNGNTFDVAFSAGAGISHSFKTSTLEVGYRYLNSGSSKLGVTPVQNTNETLKTGKLQTHLLELRVIA